MQKHIFRKSDIRGIVGIELQMQDIYPLAQAILSWFIQKNPETQRIAVAMDGRVHSQEIYQNVSQVIVDFGYQVDFLGICPTPVFEYALYQLPVQAGIMITASASPAEYNGFKLYLDKVLVQADDLQTIYQYYQDAVMVPYNAHTVLHHGKIMFCPVINQYIDVLWKEFAHLSEYDFSIVIDCGNGTTGPVIKKIIEKMNWKQVITICDVVDGAFPVHNPEPCDIKNMQVLQQTVRSSKALFGVAFDGDGDRMVVYDQKGNMIEMLQLSELFAQSIIQSNVSKKINNASLQSMFTWQEHGRFYFKDRHNPGYPDAMYAFLRLLDFLVKERKSLQELLLAVPIMESAIPQKMFNQEW